MNEETLRLIIITERKKYLFKIKNYIEASEKIDYIRGEFFEYIRSQIESSTKKVFDQLAWKQEHFEDVKLDQSFRLEVIDRWGYPTRQELSAGERQILSLSFICAM